MENGQTTHAHSRKVKFEEMLACYIRCDCYTCTDFSWLQHWHFNGQIDTKLSCACDSHLYCFLNNHSLTFSWGNPQAFQFLTIRISFIFLVFFIKDDRGSIAARVCASHYITQNSKKSPTKNVL